MVPIHMYFVTQNVMFLITFLHMICQETSFFSSCAGAWARAEARARNSVC